MTKSEKFKAVADRNALRRSSGLPLLDMRREIARLEYVEAMRRYVEGFALHAARLGEVRLEVMADLRARNGPGFGGGSRWMTSVIVDARAMPIYREYLGALGYVRPASQNAVAYGSAKGRGTEAPLD